MAQAREQGSSTISSEPIELVHDMLLVIALYTSVFDVPNLVLVNKFFASLSDVLWRYHAWRIYKLHPQSVLPDAPLGKPLTYWHDRFFMKYNDHYGFKFGHNKNYFRRGLQISEGRVKDFISEYYDGIPVKKSGKDEIIEDKIISIYALFGEEGPVAKRTRSFYYPGLVEKYDIPQQRPALLALAQQLPKEDRKCVLDLFYKETVLPYCGKEKERKRFPSVELRFSFSKKFIAAKSLSVPELREKALGILNVELLRYALEFKTLAINQLILLCRMLIDNEPILLSLIGEGEMELALHLLKYDDNLEKRYLFEEIFEAAYERYCKSFDPHSVWLEIVAVDIKTRKAEKDLWFYCRDKFPEDYSSAIKKISANPETYAFLCELESPIQNDITEVRCKI